MRIPSLEDLSIWRRVAVALVILFIAAMIVLLLSLVLDDEKATSAPAARYVVPEKFRTDVATLERQAADQAYVEHIVGLYSTWVSQVANLGHETERIDKGLDNNRKAYVIARERMEK
jgi:hypothetical protein